MEIRNIGITHLPYTYTFYDDKAWLDTQPNSPTPQWPYPTSATGKVARCGFDSNQIQSCDVDTLRDETCSQTFGRAYIHVVYHTARIDFDHPAPPPRQLSTAVQAAPVLFLDGLLPVPEVGQIFLHVLSVPSYLALDTESGCARTILTTSSMSLCPGHSLTLADDITRRLKGHNIPGQRAAGEGGGGVFVGIPSPYKIVLISGGSRVALLLDGLKQLDPTGGPCSCCLLSVRGA